MTPPGLLGTCVFVPKPDAILRCSDLVLHHSPTPRGITTVGTATSSRIPQLFPFVPPCPPPPTLLYPSPHVTLSLPFSAGDQRCRDPGTGTQRPGSVDGHPPDLPAMEGQQRPMHEKQPPHLLAAMRSPRGLPPIPGGQCDAPSPPPSMIQAVWLQTTTAAHLCRIHLRGSSSAPEMVPDADNRKLC